jgi:hypothetical protein
MAQCTLLLLLGQEAGVARRSLALTILAWFSLLFDSSVM